MEQVILVDENDVRIGTMEKMEAHEKGVLHRAFSIFIFNSRGEMLMQQRALDKYHSAGLWSNACCSHPRPGEETLAAAKRRLMEEMGFRTELREIFHFTYQAQLENGLKEHEFDHVLAGVFDGPVIFNTQEVFEVQYFSLARLRESLAMDPEKYSVWFRLAFPRIEQWWVQQYPTVAS